MNHAHRPLLGALALTWLLAAVAALGVYAYSSHLCLTRLHARLAMAPRIEAALAARQLDELRLRADHLAMDPAFVDYVAQSLVPNPAQGNAIDSASISDLLVSRRENFDLAMVLDPNGKPAARSGTLWGDAAGMGSDPAVAHVIATLKPAQAIRIEQGHILLVVAEPLLRGGALQGVLFTAKELGSTFARSVAAVSNVAVAMIATPAAENAFMPQSGLTPDMVQAIRHDLARTPKARQAVVRSLELHVAGRSLPAIAAPLHTRGGSATLVALDPEFDEAAAAMGTAWPLWLGILVLGGIASGFAVLRWRRTDVPLEQVCAILERGVHGDHALVIRTRGSATLRRLRDLINDLLAQMSTADAEMRTPNHKRP